MNLKTINKVTDSSLGRLMNLLNDKTYAIITAYRDSDTEGNELSKQENLQRNRELRARFNANKMGVYSLVGHWQETHEVERCYVVPKRSDISDEEFIDFIKDAMTINGLTQDACIFHTDKFYLLFNDGTIQPIGTKVSLNKLGQAYSKSVLKNEVPFVFDSVERPTSVAGYMWFDKNNILYLR